MYCVHAYNDGYSSKMSDICRKSCTSVRLLKVAYMGPQDHYIILYTGPAASSVSLALHCIVFLSGIPSLHCCLLCSFLIFSLLATSTMKPELESESEQQHAQRIMLSGCPSVCPSVRPAVVH